MKTFSIRLDLEPLQAPVPLQLNNYRRVLVLAPHPDDESIGCGGLVRLLAEQGVSGHFVQVTDGGGAGALPETAKADRYQEFTAAAQVLAPQFSRECWQYSDGALVVTDDLKQHISRALARYQPDIILLPWLQDMHGDHAALGQAGLEVWQGLQHQSDLLFYEVWSPLPANAILDISRVWSYKKQAIAQHKTALKELDYSYAIEGLGAYRSLILPHSGPEHRYAEAFVRLGSPASETQEANGEGSDRLPKLNQYHFRYATVKDAEAITALFSEVFGHQVDDRWWSHKYKPQLLPGALAQHQSGAIVAYYGALGRTAYWRSTPIRVVQQADVMVAKDHRFATKGQGVFSALCQLFFDEQIGADSLYQLAYGFPTPRALKLGIRLGLYQEGDPLYHLSVSGLCPQKLGLGWRYRVQNCSKIAQWHWLSEATTFAECPDNVLWLEKTPDYWRQRFAEHPEKTYQLITLKRWGQWQGAAIVQPKDNTLEIMDLALRSRPQDSARTLLPRASTQIKPNKIKPKVRQKLLQAIIESAYRQGKLHIEAWGSRCAIDSLRQYLPDHLDTTEQQDGKMALCSSERFDSPTAEAALGRYWMLGGDTDFR